VAAHYGERMADSVVPDYRAQALRFQPVSVVASVASAALFLGSAALQLVASLQRWVVFRGSLSEPLKAEDHLYDYSYPWVPWEPIGTAAEFFGVGMLLLALGGLIMPAGMLARPASARRGIAVLTVVLEFVLAILVAGSFAVLGTHALISGLGGVASPLRFLWGLGWFGFFGLIGLGVLWWQRSWAAMLACAFLLAATWPLGWFVSTYLIAPIIAGSSYDTAPWSETVVAVFTAAAGVAMIVSAAPARRRPATAPSGSMAHEAVPEP
jgi:hypothetical protein